MKAHLLDSNDPLKEGQALKALCGRLIVNSQFVFFFDSDKVESFNEVINNSLLFCSKCGQLEIEKRYVYGLIDGQDARLVDEKKFGVDMLPEAEAA